MDFWPYFLFCVVDKGLAKKEKQQQCFVLLCCQQFIISSKISQCNSIQFRLLFTVPQIKKQYNISPFMKIRQDRPSKPVDLVRESKRAHFWASDIKVIQQYQIYTIVILLIQISNMQRERHFKMIQLFLMFLACSF